MAADKTKSERTRLYRLAGMGMELTGAIIGGCLIGWFIDREFQTRYGLLTGACIGIAGGLYNLIRQSLKVFHNEQQDKQPQNDLDGAD